jgi:hypothetical protein
MYALELMKNQLSSATKPPRGLRAKANLLHDSDFGIVNKKEINDMADFVKKNNNNNGKRNNSRKPNNNVPKDFGSKREVGIKAPDVCAGTIEYKMGKVMAEQILNDAKTKSGKLPKPAQEILCDYVNRECGLKGFCVKVLVDIN